MSSRSLGDRPENTMLIKAPAFTKSGRAWRPFAFSNLEKVSKRHATLARNLEWLVPNVRSTGEVSAAVSDRLKEMLEEEVSLRTEYVHVVPMSQLKHYVAEPTFLAVLSPSPNKTRGLLEVELGLAHHAIDMLLGGTGDAVALRPLTDIEEGVMTYVLLEMLRALSPSLDSNLPKLRIEGVVRSFDDVQQLIPENENLAVMQLKAVFGGQSGFMRLIIPEDVLATANPAQDAQIRRARRAADAETNGALLRNVPVGLRVEIGTVDISAGDLAQIDKGDVILVDALTCRPDSGEAGTAKIRIGPGRHGHIDADISFDGACQATISGFTLGAPPLPAQDIINADPPSEPEAGADDDDESTTPGSIRGRDDLDDAQGAAADLMNDIPLQIAIELGRLNRTAEEVVGLKVGQVFDLARVAGEPVDLSVNGKIVARAELVEVDGNLGVRILSLAG